jgi:hypothetical protein
MSDKPNSTDKGGTLAFIQDLKPGWLNIARRMQQVARTQQGLAIIRVTVIVDESGAPIQWLAPEMSLFEPKSSKTQFLDWLKSVADPPKV